MRRGEEGEAGSVPHCSKRAPFALWGILRLPLSFLPRGLATMCLTSCEIKGKAIVQINEYTGSVWYVFVHVANFQFPLPMGIRIA